MIGDGLLSAGAAGMQTISGRDYPDKGLPPSALTKWADDRLRSMGITPARERPDAIVCPVCHGACYVYDSDGREVWCPGDCRHSGVMRQVPHKCSVCGYGGGYHAGNINLPVDNPEFGTAILCSSCQMGRSQVATRLVAAGLPVAYHGWTLETFAPLANTESRIEAWRLAAGLTSNLAEFERRNQRAGLFLHGPAGVGKTGIAAAVAASLAASTGGRIRWLPWRSWLGELRYAMRADSPAPPDYLIDVAGGADVLVVDDFGSHGQGGTDWQRDVAWRLFELRYQRHQRPGAVTIVTSNLPAESLEAAFGQPTVSRILGVAMPVRMTGEDARVPTVANDDEQEKAA